ncbi:serine/threonine protein kinase [Planctomicrobium sp.]|jgi:eukaryotic-like serine/threonine-protein kinase|nr:serine/threonine-protein kinase [Planctomicrobium sp.]MDB4733214.1 serine/threonine protein kinase [Planctomicrobium sp.]
MSQVEIQPVSAESNSSGLTFVRPLPKGPNKSHAEDLSGIQSPHQQVEFASRLFPPRYQEDSGQIPAIAGLKLGHFVLEERIGRGGMGAVFRAIDQRLNRVVALKILSPDLSIDSDAVQRFQNEARAAAKLDHDNIARVHYIGEENGLHFIAFEFVTGTNVREFIIQKGRLTPESALNYTLQIAEALRHTSSASVVHRDVKPSNIIISPTGRAKLVDLGLARHQPADQAQDLTVAGTALGTFDYISPEQAIDARNVDVRSDIYSLGCTMYHMLTGEPPYPKGTMFQKVINHHGPSPPSATEKNPLVSVQLSRVVQKMMASNPDERYASADSLIHDLIQIAENLNLTPTYPEAVVWTTPLFKARNPYWDSSRTWMAVALVLLLLVYLVDRIQPDGRISVAGQSDPINSVKIENASVDEIVLGEKSPPPNTNPAVQMTAKEIETIPANDASDLEEPSQDIIPGEVSGLASTGLSGIGWLSQSSSTSADEMWASIQGLQFNVKDQIDEPVTTQESSRPDKPVGITSPPPIRSDQPTLPFIVTQSKTGEETQVATLTEAIALAIDNSVIEIQVDGLLPLQQSAIQFSNKRVILRAADKLHPVIRFDLGNELALRPLASSAAVFDIGHGGSLELYDIDIELKVDPKTTVDEWAMVQLAPGAEFESRWCTFHINNPDEIPASLVYIPSSEPADISNIMPERMSGRPSKIQLRDSFFRGQIDGVKQNELHPLEILIDETALAITGTLHRVNGANSVETNMTTESTSQSSLTMNHVTAILGQGLLSATTGDHGTLETVAIDIRNSVLKLIQPDVALIALKGHLDAEVLKDKIFWQSQTDQSFVESEGPLFTIESSSSFLFEPKAVPLRELTLTMKHVVPDEVFQADPIISSLTSQKFPLELFFLNNNAENPAIKSASDGRNAGVDWSRSGILELIESPASNSDATEFSKSKF